MRIVLLLLLTIQISAQQVIDLCNKPVSHYYITGRIDNLNWSVNGQEEVTDTLTVDWREFNEGIHFIKVYSSDPCDDEQSLTINVIKCQEQLIWFPNAFTPDNDNLNNSWKPSTYNIDSLRITIWTREGQLIYEEQNATELIKGWNGFYMNELCMIAVYVYRVEWNRGSRIGRITLVH